jgi:hypothetical protein
MVENDTSLVFEWGSAGGGECGGEEMFQISLVLWEFLILDLFFVVIFCVFFHNWDKIEL